MITAPTITRSTRRAAQAAALLALAALLAGCAESSTGAYAYSVQDKFDYKTCDELTVLYKSYSKTIDDLVSLQHRAEREAGGTLVGGIAYGPTLSQARADRHMVERTQTIKSCPPPKPAQH